MENPIEEIAYKGHVIKVYYDTDAQDPEEWGDNNAFLVHYHRDFCRENEKVLCEGDLRDLYQGNTTEKTKELKKLYHIFPVSAYIHSGVSLSLGRVGFAFDPGGWDTSHVGAMFMAKSEWRLSKSAEKFAEARIEAWNQYLSGSVYGYQVEGDICDDSCWGFYGDTDYVIGEAKSQIDYAIGEALKKKARKTKAYIQNHVPLEKREHQEVRS